MIIPGGSPTFIHFSYFFPLVEDRKPRPGPRRSSQNSQSSQGSGGSSQPLLLPSTLQTTYSEEAGILEGILAPQNYPKPSNKSCVLFSLNLNLVDHSHMEPLGYKARSNHISHERCRSLANLWEKAGSKILGKWESIGQYRTINNTYRPLANWFVFQLFRA